MLLAMGMAAFICVFIGVYPAALYHILPFPVTYQPYTLFHVIGMIELLLFGTLAFVMLILSGCYPSELRAVNLDTDWFLRMPGRAFIRFCQYPLKTMGQGVNSFFVKPVAWACRTPLDVARIEKFLDHLFHKLLTDFPFKVFVWIKPLKTDDQQVSWNLFYILVFFVFILVFILVSTG